MPVCKQKKEGTSLNMQGRWYLSMYICRCVHIIKFQVTIGLPNRDVNCEVNKNMNVHLGICVEIDAHAFLYVYVSICAYIVKFYVTIRLPR